MTERPRLQQSASKCFINQHVELIELTVDEQGLVVPKRRRPHPDIAGKGRTLGDLLEPEVGESDWECLK